MAVLMPMEGRFKLSQGEERELLVQLAPDLRRLKAVYGVDPKAMWGIDI